MEIINKKSVSIKNNNARSLQRRHIVIDEVKLYFTAALVREFDLKVGEYMHFMNEGDKWQFFTNDDTDGFALTPVRLKGGINVNNTALCRLILKSTGYNPPKKYSVIKTNIMNDRCPVYEIVNYSEFH